MIKLTTMYSVVYVNPKHILSMSAGEWKAPQQPVCGVISILYTYGQSKQYFYETVDAAHTELERIIEDMKGL